MVLQSELVQKRIANHQGSSPTPTFSASKSIATGRLRIAHKLILLKDRVQTLKKANKALAKRRRAKRTRLQGGGSLNREEAQVLIDKKEAKGSKQQKRWSEGSDAEAGPATQRRCGNCGRTGHNIRTCQEVEETSDKGSNAASDCINCVVVE